MVVLVGRRRSQELEWAALPFLPEAAWVEMARLLIYPVLVAWVVPRLVVPHVLRAPMAFLVLLVHLGSRLQVLVRVDMSV